MSGHSKWKNIMHKKEKTDSQRAKLFTKIGKEIAMIVKEGGPDPVSNSKLRDVIVKAKSNNVPNDNIDRIIKKAAGGDGANYEEIRYEGYGPKGIAVIVDTLTDNRNRTAGDIRYYFDKNGGNLGQVGSVSWMFEEKGVIIIEKDKIDEDTLTEDAIEAGADDISISDEVFEIYTDKSALQEVKENLEKSGYKFLSVQLEYIPSTYVELDDADDIKNFTKLTDALDDNEDVIDVWHNCEE